jgi:hypothetical protein
MDPANMISSRNMIFSRIRGSRFPEKLTKPVGEDLSFFWQ